ncbi:WD repeat and FYVE domain-containing protein 2 [Paramecium bursaria]
MLKNESVNVEVISYKEDNKYIIYKVQIKTRTKKQWLLDKRYSQFEELNKKLQEMFQNLPQLPKKSFITVFVGKSKEELEDRRVGLDTYLKNLIVRKDIFNCQILREFLELDKMDDLVPPQLAFEQVLLYGVRDFIIAKEPGLLFVLNSDMSLLNRVDAYVTNMKMPWESERGEPTTQSVGRVECYQMDDQSFTKLWEREYNAQAICLYWDPASKNLLVGLDSGTINVLQISTKTNKFEESLEIEMHTERVMGLFQRKNLVNSISKDRHYRIVDLDKAQLAVDIELSQAELTYMIYNSDRYLAIVGDRAGQLFLMNVQFPKPSIIATFQFNTPFIRGIYFDDVKNYIIACGYNEGGLTVLDVGKAGQESQAKIKTKLESKIKSRELQWSRKRGELMVGNDDGTITIYNAIDLQPIYVLKAHEGAVTKLQWFEESQILMTGGKDKKLKWWQFPKDLLKKEFVEKEQQQIIAESKLLSMLKVQEDNRKKDLDSDEDDNELGQWHK